MKKYFRGIALELFNKYVSYCEGRNTKVDYDYFLKQVGIQVNHFKELTYVSHLYENDLSTKIIHRSKITKKQYRLELHSAVNDIINSVFDEKIMIFGEFAKRYEKIMIQLHGSWDNYLKLPLLDRFESIEFYITTLGYEINEEYDEQHNGIPKIKSITAGDILVANPNPLASDALFYEVYLLKLKLIKYVSENFNSFFDEETRKAVHRLNTPVVLDPISIYSREKTDKMVGNSLYGILSSAVIDPISIHSYKTADFPEIMENQSTDEVSDQSPVDKLIVDIRNVFYGVVETIKAKNSDYTKDNYNPFHNFEKSIKYGVNPVDGMLVRIQDKMSRLHALESGHDAKVDEKSEDTIIDAIGYFALLSGLIKKQQRPYMEESLSLIKEVILELVTYNEFRKNG